MKMASLRQTRTEFPTGHHQRLHECLVHHGLIGKSAMAGGPIEVPSGPSSCSALRLALQELGDPYCLFGLYLSTRIDLLSPQDCEALSHMTNRASPSPFAEGQEFVESQLGIAVDEAFLAVEPTPYHTSVLRDSYLATLRHGQDVSVHVLRPEYRHPLTGQLDALRMLARLALFQHWPLDAASQVVDDFSRELNLRVNFLQEADTVDALALDAQAGDGFWSPRTIREYCRPGVLTVDQRPCLSLSAIVPGKVSRDGAEEAPVGRSISSERLARLLCLTWLRQVIHGRAFPVQFGPDDVFLLDDSQLAFFGGVLSTSPSDAKENIWKYLLAVAADNPDDCCRSLLNLMYKQKDTEATPELLASFRQAVTCFMSAPGQADLHSGLAARILRHLQLAIQAGYRPLPEMLTFYRGLFCTLRAVRALRPTVDPVLEAVEGIWIQGIFGSARQMILPDALGDIASKYAAAMMEFPRRLDALLSQPRLLKEDREFSESGTRSTNSRDPSYPIVGVLLLTAILLLVRNSPIGFAPAWIDGVSF